MKNSMKNDFKKYNVGDVYLLKDGSYIMIVGRSEGLSNACDCKVGHLYRKGEQFKKDGTYLMILEDPISQCKIAMDISKTVKYSFEELNRLETHYFGSVSDEKHTEYKKLVKDWMKENDWD